MQQNIRFVLLSIFVVLVFTACSNNSTQNNQSDPTTGSSTPVSSANESGLPYPSPIDVSSTPLPTVTIDPSLGTVHGTLNYKGKPLANTVLYLATVLRDSTSGSEIATSLDRVQAPKTMTDENGFFEFRNVPEGRYGLTLLDALDTFLLLNPKDGTAILLTVEKGSNVDLDKFDFDDLPVD